MTKFASLLVSIKCRLDQSVKRFLLDAQKMSTCTGSPSSFSRPADEKRFIQAKMNIAAAAAARRRNKADKGMLVSRETVRGNFKRKNSSSSGPIAKRQRSKDPNIEDSDYGSFNKSRGVVRAR